MHKEARMNNKQEILKKLALDFAKYRYLGDGLVFRVDKKSGGIEVFSLNEGWKKSDVDIVSKANNIFEGGLEVDVYLEGDEDSIVEQVIYAETPNEEFDDEE